MYQSLSRVRHESNATQQANFQLAAVISDARKERCYDFLKIGLSAGSCPIVYSLLCVACVIGTFVLFVSADDENNILPEAFAVKANAQDRCKFWAPLSSIKMQVNHFKEQGIIIDFCKGKAPAVQRMT